MTHSGSDRHSSTLVNAFAGLLPNIGGFRAILALQCGRGSMGRCSTPYIGHKTRQETCRRHK
jgi:hypothetical protein